jgi:5-methylcytosine-specific restriction endonuclease McrA
LRCGKRDPTVDHVILLVSKEAAPIRLENVQVLCAPCTSDKGCEVVDYRTP